MTEHKNLQIRRAKGRARKGVTSPTGTMISGGGLMRVPGVGSRVLRVIATTDDIDLDDEVVIAGGVDARYFSANRAVFIDHATGVRDRVGVARAISPWPASGKPRGWTVDVAVDRTPLGDEVLAKCRAGGMGVSIGFRCLDRGEPTAEEIRRHAKGGLTPRSIVRSWEWLELSFTPMPCNVACRVVGLGTDQPPARQAPKGSPSPRRGKRRLVIGADGKVFTRLVGG